MANCEKCGCGCSDNHAKCDKCALSEDVKIALVDEIALLGGYDHCKRPLMLRNKKCAILFSDGNCTRFLDGSDGERLKLKNLRCVNALDSVSGLQDGSLAQIKLEEGQILQKEGGKIVGKDLVFPAKFQLTEVPSYQTGGKFAMLYPDEDGNLCLQILDIDCGCDCKPEDKLKDHIITLDCNGKPTCRRYQDLDFKLDHCALGYWDAEQQCFLPVTPPDVSGENKYEDYEFKLNEDGKPVWVLNAKPTLVGPAHGLFTGPCVPVNNVTESSIPLTLTFDGGGANPAFVATGTCVTATTAGQLSLMATAQVGPVSGDHVSMYWKKDGVRVANPQGEGFVQISSAGPMINAIWAGNVKAGDTFCLCGKAALSHAKIYPSSVVATYLPSN